VHRVRLELERSRDRQQAYERVGTILGQMPDSPQRQEAWRLANDRLGLTVQLRGGVSSTAAGAAPISPKLISAGERLERSVLAGVAAHPELTRMLERVTPEHFEYDVHRRMREHLLGNTDADGELTSLLADLHARADLEAIDKVTAEQQLLRLRERRLQRELSDAGDAHLLIHLQQELLNVRTAIRDFA
jgi:hypothetical protein